MNRTGQAREMAYSAVGQSEQGTPPDGACPAALQTLFPDLEPLKSPNSTRNVQEGDASEALNNHNDTEQLRSLLKSMTSPGDGYSLAAGDEYGHVGHNSHNEASGPTKEPIDPYSPVPLGENGETRSMWMPRTVSREGSVLRHPKADLQTMQGAYVGNVERIEQSAERLHRLSLRSNLDEELRKMRAEQYRSDSRRSSVFDNSIEEGVAMPSASRRPSYGSNACYSNMSLNSAARSGGFSPTGYRGSPRNSVKGRSASYAQRFAQLPEPEKEGKPLDSPVSGGSASIIRPSRSKPNALRITNEDESSPEMDVRTPPENSPSALPELAEPEHSHENSSLLMRSNTNASTDTYSQANGLFTDFDGVHITPQAYVLDEVTSSETPEEIGLPNMPKRRSHLGRPLSYAAPPPGQISVYYPAPVPEVLDLPDRLSKLPPSAVKDRRRTQVLKGLPAEARRSAMWLPGVPESEQEGAYSGPRGDSLNAQEDATDLPPQLRASTFFEYPAVSQVIEIKDGSAMATLDSILDASVHAPVTAFTDHPIAGNLGKEVYGRPQTARRSTVNLMGTNADQRPSSPNRRSTFMGDMQKRTSSLLSWGFGRRKSHDSNGDEVEMNAAGNGVVDPDLTKRNVEEQYHSAAELVEGIVDEQTPLTIYPTTLLAEREIRHQQQKDRGRTAVSAFPGGMRSTLLELDTVTQLQQQSQKGKHIQLAWEDRKAQHSGAEGPDDDDVPLAILYPSSKIVMNHKASRFDENRPLGLIEKREMEDNEPLSHRRARLKGIPLPLPEKEDPNRKPTMVGLEVQGLSGNRRGSFPPEVEGETLAQRQKRIKGGQQNRLPSSEFTSEIMSQFGGLPGNTDKPLIAPDPDDQSLSQVRKRVLAERAAKARNVSDNSESSATRPRLTQRRSMADILQAHPAGLASNGLPQTSVQRIPNGRIHMSNNISTAQLNTTAISQQRYSDNFMPPYNSSNSVPMAAAPGTHRQLAGQNSHNYNYNSMIHYGAAFPRVGPGLLAPGQAPMEVDQRQRQMIDRWRESVGP